MKPVFSSRLIIAVLSSFPLMASASSQFAADLPVAGSIAMPGATTATFTNAAGLVGNRSASVSLQAGSEHPMDNPVYRGLLLAGNGTIGASVGMDYQSMDVGKDRSSVVYGLALNIDALHLALGVSGRTGLKVVKGNDFNAGLLFSPLSVVTIGATAMGLENGADSYGVGLGISVFSGVDLVVDAGLDSDFKNPELKPGIAFSNQYAGLSLSFGTGTTDTFSKDFSTSAFFRLGMYSKIEIEYNHGGKLPKYYAGLTLGL